jgi:hypothetical protein
MDWTQFVIYALAFGIIFGVVWGVVARRRKSS